MKKITSECIYYTCHQRSSSSSFSNCFVGHFDLHAALCAYPLNERTTLVSVYTHFSTGIQHRICIWTLPLHRNIQMIFNSLSYSNSFLLSVFFLSLLWIFIFSPHILTEICWFFLVFLLLKIQQQQNAHIKSVYNKGIKCKNVLG